MRPDTDGVFDYGANTDKNEISNGAASGNYSIRTYMAMITNTNFMLNNSACVHNAIIAYIGLRADVSKISDENVAADFRKSTELGRWGDDRNQ